MNIYTVTTELNNSLFFRGITDNIDEYIKKHFPKAVFVKDLFKGSKQYIYTGGLGDDVSLIFTYHTDDIYLSLHIEGDAKYIL